MILLVQVRDTALPEEQEVRCFHRLGSIAPGAMDTYSVVRRPEIAWKDVEGYDTLMIGGSGEYSATEDHPFTAPLEDVLRRWVKAERPFLGSCWGHHFLGRALGGEVITDPAAEEVGTFDVTLTEAALDDPVLGDLPRTFPAQLGHHDRISRLPEGLIELAASARCPNQAIKVEDAPAYGTQFHCEMDEPQLRERLQVYADSYLEDGVAGLDRILRPGPDAVRILRRFVELYG